MKAMVGIVCDFFSSRFCASVRGPRSPVIKTPIIIKPTIIRFLVFSQVLIIVSPLPSLSRVNPVHFVSAYFHSEQRETPNCGINRRAFNAGTDKLSDEG